MTHQQRAYHKNSSNMTQGIMCFIRHHTKLIGYPIAILFVQVLLAALLILALQQTLRLEAPELMRSGAVNTHMIYFTVIVITLLCCVPMIGISYILNAALIYCILQKLQGKSCNTRKAIHAACAHWRALITWGLINLTVGQIISAMERAHPSFARLVFSSILQWTWILASLFVVPIIMTEHLSAVDALKHSATLIKDNKRKAFALLGRYGLLFIVIPTILYAAYTTQILSLNISLIIGIPLMVTLLLLFSFANSIAKSAIYLRLSGQENIKYFDSLDLDRALTNQTGWRR